MKRTTKRDYWYISTLGVPIAAVGLAGTAHAQVPTAQLQQALPDASIQVRSGRISRITGQGLATGASPEAAAEAFRVKAAQGLSAVPEDLVRLEVDTSKTMSSKDGPGTGLMYDKATGKYKFYLYRYGQARGNVPVHGAELRTLVKNEAGYPVVWAASTLRDLKDFSPTSAKVAAIDDTKLQAAISAYAGTAKAQRAALPAVFESIGKAEPVIFAGTNENPQAPRMALQFVAENASPLAKVRFVVDAQTGEVLDSVPLLRNVNVGGTIRGVSTVGPRPFDPGDAACAATANTPMPYASVGIQFGTSGYTSNTGYYYLTNPGTAAVTVESPVQGQYFSMTDDAGAIELLTSTVVPPNAANFLHNAANTSEFLRAESVGYIHVNRVRDFLLGYLPSYPGVSAFSPTNLFPVTVNSNIAGCPNAWGGAGGLTFCRASGTGKNSAFGDVIYHEFGHAIIDFGGSGNDAYHEGMADAIATSLDESAGWANGWFSNCSTATRMMQNTVQYDATDPACTPPKDPHACGMLLGGVIFDIRQQLMTSNPGDYRDILNPMMFSSIPMNGGSPIGPDILDDFLSLDDDNGNLADGTPHRTQICAGFNAHGITDANCPPPGPTTPCGSVCSPATVFNWGGSYWSGELGTGAVCRETTHTISGGNCGNLTGGRTLYVNGVPMACNNQNWASIPAKVRGGYCITTTPGDYRWAYFQVW